MEKSTANQTGALCSPVPVDTSMKHSGTHGSKNTEKGTEREEAGSQVVFYETVSPNNIRMPTKSQQYDLLNVSWARMTLTPSYILN